MTHPRIKAVRPIRAKRMYLHTYADGYDIFKDFNEALRRADQVVRMEGDGPKQSTVGVIDQSDEAQAALVEQVAAYLQMKMNAQGYNSVETVATGLLSSLGLLTPARRRKL